MMTNRERVIRAIDAKRLPLEFLKYAEYILDEIPAARFINIKEWFKYNASVSEILATNPYAKGMAR